MQLIAYPFPNHSQSVASKMDPYFIKQTQELYASGDH